MLKNQTSTKYVKIEIERDPNLTSTEYRKIYQKKWLEANRSNFNGSSCLTYYKKTYGKELTMQYIVINNYDYKEAIKSMKMDILLGNLKPLDIPENKKKREIL